jgi:hypothetical protein
MPFEFSAPALLLTAGPFLSAIDTSLPGSVSSAARPASPGIPAERGRPGNHRFSETLRAQAGTCFAPQRKWKTKRKTNAARKVPGRDLVKPVLV